ncbi:homoserine kinase [Sinomicrobium soli]|uniref:homoserine kinase n=1 Tax=Sinomicrobium sp. N-1-3-6 TaxID=2219864 RepID=UPI000DCEBFDE|nr:homoserine kinase [Sinomicrobium sp. N-1-3-6]RAV28717.1 homoserine kinase [Sinomicrobium sp. N-1-3-6]
MKELRIFCPATIANVACGFDVLGLCLDHIGDEMVVRKTGSGQVTISRIEGQDLPLEAANNVAGVSAMALLKALGSKQGFDMEIHKKIKPGSGIGSSAASAAGAVFAINRLLGEPFTLNELIPFAMEGEKLASGALHADNVAPALLGGFSLVRSYDPLDVIRLHTPGQLYATIIHPQIEVKTADARSVLKHSVPLKKAIAQWGNVGGLVSGLYTEDYDLIGRSLHDGIVEPLRSLLIPRFDQVKQASAEAGALGSGISGSGPSIFALSKGEHTAKKVAEAMTQVYADSGVAFDVHVSGISHEGVRPTMSGTP